MTERQWLPSFGELLDRWSIIALKYHFNPSGREEIKKEIDAIRHDIKQIMVEKGITGVDADFLWHFLNMSQFNAHIFYNERAAREGDPSKCDLYFTHQANGVRCRARDFLNQKLEERQDPKVAALAANIPDFEPHW